MKAEDIADRSRAMGVKLQASQMTWCLPAFYLLGRELLLSYGLLRPQDAVEDIVYVMDFWKRFQLSWQRNNGHLSNAQAGHRAQILPIALSKCFAPISSSSNPANSSTKRPTPSWRPPRNMPSWLPAKAGSI